MMSRKSDDGRADPKYLDVDVMLRVRVSGRIYSKIPGDLIPQILTGLEQQRHYHLSLEDALLKTEIVEVTVDDVDYVQK
jgi:hypothetical protein